MPKNSAAGGIYGGFTASKIRRLIRRAVIFPADFRRTNFRRRIRRSAAAEGSSLKDKSPPVESRGEDPVGDLQETEAVFKHCLQISTDETIKT